MIRIPRLFALVAFTLGVVSVAMLTFGADSQPSRRLHRPRARIGRARRRDGG